MCHNGEINTIRGNKFWSHAREQSLSSRTIPEDDLTVILPAVQDDGSDSMALDNLLELLLHAGYSLPQAMMITIPEAWESVSREGSSFMTPALRAFYEYHASMQEPWDGPANVAFCDGYHYLGAKLDRSGLRPCRVYVMRDGTVIMGSEVGMLRGLQDEKVALKTRVPPGGMFVVDLRSGKPVLDPMTQLSNPTAIPYAEWVGRHLLRVPEDSASKVCVSPLSLGDACYSLSLCGYTTEQLEFVLRVMFESGQEGLGSMGNDQCLAVMSDQPRPLFDYFRQLFAQVTNPPIDPIREAAVMSLVSFLGRGGNLLHTQAEGCRTVQIDNPVLGPVQFQYLHDLCEREKGWGLHRIDATFSLAEGLQGALERVKEEAVRVVRERPEVQLLIISDRQHIADRSVSLSWSPVIIYVYWSMFILILPLSRPAAHADPLRPSYELRALCSQHVAQQSFSHC